MGGSCWWMGVPIDAFSVSNFIIVKVSFPDTNSKVVARHPGPSQLRNTLCDYSGSCGGARKTGRGDNCGAARSLALFDTLCITTLCWRRHQLMAICDLLQQPTLLPWVSKWTRGPEYGRVYSLFQQQPLGKLEQHTAHHLQLF